MEELKKSDKEVMEDWRNYLGINGKAADILFEIIEKAIMVAASHYPLEFQIQREKIAKILYSINCCDDVEEENIGCMKMSDDPNVNNLHHWDTINHSSHEETKIVNNEVLRIKEILDTDQSESDSEPAVVYELLLKLQDMGLSYKNLEATKIGRSVNRFKKHGSTDVRLIARSLIKMWTAVADEWFEKTSCVEKEDEEKQKEEEKEESIIKAKAAEKKQMDLKKEASTTTSRTNVIKIKIIKRNSEKEAKMEEKTSSINTIEKKLEATKRKLHQRYEEVENAKRQRKIQVVELHQLPKDINQNRKSLKMW